MRGARLVRTVEALRWPAILRARQGSATFANFCCALQIGRRSVPLMKRDASIQFGYFLHGDVDAVVVASCNATRRTGPLQYPRPCGSKVLPMGTV